jgi:hypothetical protein
MLTMDDEIRAVIDSTSASDWLRQALATALQRDCVDAANDAEQLSDLLSRRCSALLAGSTSHG